MKYIDMEKWPRRKHYQLFSAMDYPHLSLSAVVDITRFLTLIKENELSFFKAFLYVATLTANDIKEFRYRIRPDGVIEHEVVHPSFTVMTKQDVFGFCAVEFMKDFGLFAKETAKEMEICMERPCLEDETGRDDLLYMTSIPWVSFTQIMHPIHLTPIDSIPRIAWGKYYEENGKCRLPLSVQAHHALMDGAHVGEYFTRIQLYLDRPFE